MKVLHIWNTAGVGSLISKELNKKGIESTVIMRASHDPFGFTNYYNGINLKCKSNPYIKECISLSKDYDIIHIHSALRMCQIIREEYKDKKIVFQHHGSELTNSDFKTASKAYRYCDEIITSTIDLHQILNEHNVKNTLIENAVDTDLFKPIAKNKFKPALMFNIRYVDTDASLKFVESFSDWKINLIDRESNSVPYHQMPELLNQYDKYIDIKVGTWMNGQPSQAISKTGREALACGLEVLNYKGEIVKGLPIEYTPEYMINNIIKLYNI